MEAFLTSMIAIEEENKATTGDGEEIGEGDDWDQLLVQRRDWSHHWIVAAASTCFQWLRGYKSVMAAGAEDNAAVEAGDGCVLATNPLLLYMER
ncbi:hypothetical protein NC652_038925 [Populus alba x Populus x berolinensis]|nr:hypothetical protein NC652_038925 [Populus alba x Populus x berolinensis]